MYVRSHNPRTPRRRMAEVTGRPLTAGRLRPLVEHAVGAESHVRSSESPTLPYPPLHLANRVGALEGGDPYAQYEWIGRRASEDLRAVLPADWTWDGRRVLDFGCGAGRTLRHFVREATGCEFYAMRYRQREHRVGADASVPAVPLLRQRRVSAAPLPSASLDLVYAISVFTHLTTRWSDWLLEVHRLLRPGGLALLTFMGRGMVQPIAGEALDEDEVGMIVLRMGAPWNEGGPMVLHSPWWIREHWGRAFDVLSITPDGFAWESGLGRGSRCCGSATSPCRPRTWNGPQRKIPERWRRFGRTSAWCTRSRDERGPTWPRPSSGERSLSAW